jgi:hypothetical protein
VIQPKKEEQKFERVPAASVAGGSALDLSHPKERLGSAELALLREFFELLTEWDELSKGGTRNEEIESRG